MVMEMPTLTDPGRSDAALGSSRRRVLQTLRAAATAVGVQEVCDATGLHANTARFHLDGLVGAGLAVRHAEDSGRPGRPRMVYEVTAADDPATGMRSYRLLSEILTGLVAHALPEPGPAAVAAGQVWGRLLARRPAPLQQLDADEAVRTLSAVLDDVGFAPGRAQEATTAVAPAGGRLDGGSTASNAQVIPLHHCPFREVAIQQPDVVCSLHLGLIEGVLEEVRAPLQVNRLDPLVEPAVCLAHLSPCEDGPNRPGADQQTPPSDRDAPHRALVQEATVITAGSR
jgi:predicted ArsR family transcriptional regulator